MSTYKEERHSRVICYSKSHPITDHWSLLGRLETLKRVNLDHSQYATFLSLLWQPADHLRKRCYGNDNCNCNGNYQWLQAVLEWVIRLLGTLGRVGGEDNSNRRARAIQRNMPPDLFSTLSLFAFTDSIWLFDKDMFQIISLSLFLLGHS